MNLKSAKIAWKTVLYYWSIKTPYFFLSGGYDTMYLVQNPCVRIKIHFVINYM